MKTLTKLIMERNMGRNETYETERLQAAAELGERFIGRWDLYALQLADGRYVCVRKPLTAELLLAHLDGKITLGAYLMDSKSNIRHLVFDADAADGRGQILKTARLLADKGIASYPEDSRRGAHLWLPFAEPIPAGIGRRVGKGIMKAFNLKNVELYPKQDEARDGGPGSLIRLPFGKHQLSGRRYPFLTLDGEPLAASIREQIRILKNVQTVPERAISEYSMIEPPKPVIVPQSLSGEPREASYEELKTKISVLDFVGRFVELKPTASGAVGKCPFHDDQHASFGVNAKGNYWHCFAGCGGGSIIDFWMRYRGVAFADAVKELTELFGGNPNEQ